MEDFSGGFDAPDAPTSRCLLCRFLTELLRSKFLEECFPLKTSTLRTAAPAPTSKLMRGSVRFDQICGFADMMHSIKIC